MSGWDTLKHENAKWLVGLQSAQPPVPVQAGIQASNHPSDYFRSRLRSLITVY